MRRVELVIGRRNLGHPINLIFSNSHMVQKFSIGQIVNVNLVVILRGGAQKILERALFPAVPVSAPDSKVKWRPARYFVGELKINSAG